MKTTTALALTMLAFTACGESEPTIYEQVEAQFNELDVQSQRDLCVGLGRFDIEAMIADDTRENGGLDLLPGGDTIENTAELVAAMEKLDEERCP